MNLKILGFGSQKRNGLGIIQNINDRKIAVPSDGASAFPKKIR